MRKHGARCKSDDSYLSRISSLEECANVCRNKEDCNFFVYGYDDENGQCYQQLTNSSACTEGWEYASYHFYELLGKLCNILESI